MKVIFHIGQHKTGTSSLQHTMRADKERLEAAGILFPLAGRDRTPWGALLANHNGLVNALDETRDLGWQPLSEIRSALGDEIVRVRPKTIVISAEAGFRAVERPKEVLDVFDAMLPGRVEVVAYLRRPDRYLSSRHKQLVRNGRAGRSPLHVPQRLEELSGDAVMNFDRAIGVYAERYEDVRLFDYEHVDDTIGHFYTNVLDLPAPDIARAANPSMPDVFVELARLHGVAHGRIAKHAVDALLRFGSREPVDLIGPENRRRLFDHFSPQNAVLGGLAGRATFFEDLAQMLEPPRGSISVEEATNRYSATFDELVAGPSVWDLRRDCLILERAGRVAAAQRLYRMGRHWLDDEAVAWFGADLAASSRGRLALIDHRYVDVAPSSRSGVRSTSGRVRAAARHTRARFASRLRAPRLWRQP